MYDRMATRFWPALGYGSELVVGLPMDDPFPLCEQFIRFRVGKRSASPVACCLLIPFRRGEGSYPSARAPPPASVPALSRLLPVAGKLADCESTRWNLLSPPDARGHGEIINIDMYRAYGRCIFNGSATCCEIRGTD